MIAWSNKLLYKVPSGSSPGSGVWWADGGTAPGTPAWAAGGRGAEVLARPAGSRQRGLAQSVSELLRHQYRAARDLRLEPSPLGRVSRRCSRTHTSCPTWEPSRNVQDSARVQPSRAPVLARTPHLPPARWFANPQSPRLTGSGIPGSGPHAADCLVTGDCGPVSAVTWKKVCHRP